MNELNEIIKQEIRERGPITFNRFMELALYQKEFGYYSSGNVRIGGEGDFYTSPYVNKAFGNIISRFILKGLNIVDSEEPTIVEIGGGKGVLAKDILDKLLDADKAVYNKLTYIYIEKSPTLQNEASLELKDHISKIEFYSDISEIGNKSIEGVVFSNELFDAIPFHRIVLKNEKLEEIYITRDNDNFVEHTGPLSSQDIGRYIEDYQLTLNEGQQLEINLSAALVLESITNVMKKGLLLTVDYGYLAEELYNYSRMKGTYKCMHRHSINENPYSNIGEQDITAHVNFSKLMSAGEKLGLNTVIYTTQGQFLLDWGILSILEELSAEAGKSLGKEMASIKNLFLPGSMGNSFKVLIQEKNLSSEITSFYPDSPFKISFNVV